ncbi:hypothetical protein CJ030_MR7G025999 [Morella rubra]|uniref:Uncharacterized protein n=1 Tax=Morella rubra TaxID=262757 RepID=A0A6A1UZJ0_9ROSI|nr:hypothetical protein CJ030_MR7G025999 [Morella rubra]
METKVVAIPLVVAFFGIISAAAGFAAEATRIKACQVDIYGFEYACPQSPATILGVTAALALKIATIIIFVSTGCMCCRRSDSPNSTKVPAVIFCAFCWITFVVASILLLAGAAINQIHGRTVCYVVKPGVFVGGAVLSLASVTLGIISYFILISAERSNLSSHKGETAMGQPQFPQVI